MPIRTGKTLALAVSLLGAALPAASQNRPASLLILSKSDRLVSIVDPRTLELLGQLPSGPDPHEVVASEDGKLAYISNYGGGIYNTITEVDLVDRKVSRVIDLGALRGPHGLVFAGGKLWFTAEAAKAIGRFDPLTQSIDLILGTGQEGTHMILVFPESSRLVTTNVGSATVSVMERVSRQGPDLRAAPGGVIPESWHQTLVPVGRGAEGFDLSPDRREIWVANAEDGTISIIEMATRKVVQTVEARVRGANRLKFTPDGKRVLVSTLEGPDLLVLDASSRKETKRIRVGRGAAGILVEPDGRRAFVASTPDDFVAVIDLGSLEMTGKIAAGRQPDGLAWAGPGPVR